MIINFKNFIFAFPWWPHGPEHKQITVKGVETCIFHWHCFGDECCSKNDLTLSLNNNHYVGIVSNTRCQFSFLLILTYLIIISICSWSPPHSYGLAVIIFNSCFIYSSHQTSSILQSLHPIFFKIIFCDCSKITQREIWWKIRQQICQPILMKECLESG